MIKKWIFKWLLFAATSLKLHLSLFLLGCAASAAVDVKQGERRFRAAQLELSCSHQAECQAGAQQDGRRVCACV